MIVNLSGAGQVSRILTLKDWARIIVVPVAPNPVRIATNQTEAQNIAMNGLGDGIPVNPPNGNADIFQIWWRGELFMVSINANTQCLIFIPGMERASI